MFQKSRKRGSFSCQNVDRVFIRKGVFESLPPHFSLKRGLFDLIFFPHLGVSDTNGLRFFYDWLGDQPQPDCGQAVAMCAMLF